MQKKKAERIYRMSEQFDDWDGVDATELYGIGKYGSTVTDCFTKTRSQPNVGDHELQRYINEEFKQ